MMIPKLLKPAMAALLVMLAACTSRGTPMDRTKLNDFAVKYTAAWCSHNPASVASFFADQGSLQVNDGTQAVGSAAITGTRGIAAHDVAGDASRRRHDGAWLGA
jgi:hypothetical protein